MQNSFKTTHNNALLLPWVQIACIIIFGILVYSNTFNSAFVFDDTSSVVKNMAIRNFDFTPRPFVKDGFPIYMSSKNRIIGYFTLAINYQINGLNVEGYHIVNLLIHILNALLIYMFVNLTFKTPFLRNTIYSDIKQNRLTVNYTAFLCAMLFVVHPIETGAVTYIVQRFTSLATLFYLLALVLYIQSRMTESSSRRFAYYFLSLLSTILSMRTKEISFTLPVVISLYELMFFDGSLKKRFMYILPFLLTMSIIPLTLMPLGSFDNMVTSVGAASKETASISRADYLFTQFSVIATYIRLLFLPINQNFDYDYPIYNSFFTPQVYLPFLLLLFIFTLGAYLFYRSRKMDTISGYLRFISFGIFFFFITLSVESSIIPIADVIFEHRVYLPSLGFIVSFVMALMLLEKKLSINHSKASKMLALVSAMFIILLSCTTYARNDVWKTPITFWEDASQKSPKKARAHNNLGNSYIETNRIAEGITELELAEKLDPESHAIHTNLGNAFIKAGKYEEAIGAFHCALKQDPYDVIAHNGLGIAYRNTKQFEDSIRSFKNALMLNPDLFEAHEGLGFTFEQCGAIDEAANEYQIASTLDPHEINRLNNDGTNVYKSGKIEQAIRRFQIVLKLKPEMVQAHYNLALAYQNQRRFLEAVEEFQLSIKLKPDLARAHYNLALVYRQQKRFEDALSELGTALKLQPDYSDAQMEYDKLKDKLNIKPNSH